MLILNQGIILKKGIYPVNSVFTEVEIIGIDFNIHLNLGPLRLKFTEIFAVILFRGL